MLRRQRTPSRWLIIDRALTPDLTRAARNLPPGSGILLIGELGTGELARLRRIARQRSLCIVKERPGIAARVHSQRELTRAQLHRTLLILVSPIFATSSHPDWMPMPLMRAAALARLAHRRAIALGGMNRQRYARIAPLGFKGWAGIDAWLKFTNVTRSDALFRDFRT